MKAVLLAAAALLLLFGLITFRLRFASTPKRAKEMLRLFVIVLPFLSITHVITPLDLYFLRSPWVQSAVWVDFAFMNFLYFAGFFGGVLQLYNLADRGFSLRILIDILDSRGSSLTTEDIMDSYGGGARNRLDVPEEGRRND